MKRFILSMVLVVPALLASPAWAQDEGLYDPVAPAGSAFVRFINAGTKEEALKPALNGKTYKEIGHDAVSAYFPLKAGKLDAALGAAKASAKAESGAYYTAVLNGETLTVLEDSPIGNATKAMIVFYNLSATPAALKTADGKVEVVPPVEAGKNGAREINAIPVSLAVYEGNKKLADIGAVTLKRNEATAIVASANADGTLGVATAQATTDTTQ